MKKLLIALIVLAMVSLLCARVVYGQQLPGGETPFAGVKPERPAGLQLSSGKLFRVRGSFSEVSSDGGKNWSRGGQMHPFTGGSPWAQNAIQLQAGPHKGRIVVPCYFEMDGDHPDYSRVQRGGYAIWRGKKIRLETHTHVPEMAGSFVCYSDDEGKTWQRSKGFLMGYFEDGNLGHWSCEEPAIAELKDGRILCFMRSTCGRILKSYSSDGGQYWTKVEATDIAMSNSPCALARIPKTGDLVMVWNQMSAEEICKGHRRGRLSLAISKDDGQTWENFKTLELNPGLEDLKQVSPPPLVPMVRGPSGPDHLMGTIPDEFLFFGYPTIYCSEDKIFITYSANDPVTGAGGVRSREFPISWLYLQSEEMLPSEAPQGSAKDRIQAAPAANLDGITLAYFNTPSIVRLKDGSLITEGGMQSTDGGRSWKKSPSFQPVANDGGVYLVRRQG